MLKLIASHFKSQGQVKQMFASNHTFQIVLKRNRIKQNKAESKREMIKHIFPIIIWFILSGSVEKVNHLLLPAEFFCFKNNFNYFLFINNIWKIQLKRKEKLEITHNHTTENKH